jgi:hypothetical protein
METASEVRTGSVSAAATVERERKKPISTRIWNFLISIKLAIRILILLAATSILGTVIEQNQPPEKYHQVYEDWAYNLMDRINLFDMYHSWWFLLLLSLFALNLACCTIDRLPRAIRSVRKPKLTLDDATEKTLALTKRWKDKGDISPRAETYRSALARLFAAPKVTEAEGAVHLYAEKGVTSRLGDLSLSPNEPVTIDGYGAIRGVNYEENFQGNGPAIRVVIEKPGRPSRRHSPPSSRSSASWPPCSATWA